MNPGSRKTFTLGEFVGLQRFRAKAVNFGFLYGMGWRKFRVYAKTDYGLDYTDEEAQSLRDTFFELYPGLAEWHTQMEGFVREHGYVRALHGALRRLPSVFSSEENVQHSSIRQAINSPVQRFASDLGLIALARLVRDCPLDDLRPVLFIHDALILEVKEDRVDELLPAIRFYMESSPLREMFGIVPPIPIKADLSVGPNLADMDELSGIDAEAPEWYQEDLDMAA
jgi:DNA polymerase-1